MRIGLLLFVLCVAASPALAQNLSPQQRQAILDYQLTPPGAEHLITAMQAAILKQNSLTARDYLIGVPTLRMALMAAQGATSPNIVASPANVAFAKANLAQLKPKMDAADGIRR